MVATDGWTGRGYGKLKVRMQYMETRNERPNVGGVSMRSRLRLERDAWSMVKLLRQTTNEYPPLPLPISRFMPSCPPVLCVVFRHGRSLIG